jgi:maleylpyruvate isomerase
MKLYSFWRSTCSWRVRIALHYKQLPFEYVAVDLTKGQQHDEELVRKNPMRQVPVLELDDGTHLSQSMAILDYLDEVQREPPLLPATPLLRARARQLAEMIASGIQPLQNTSTQIYVRDQLHGDANQFVRHFVEKGLTALETQVGSGRFCVGDQPSIADVCLVPELGFARRFAIPLENYPSLLRIEAACAELPGFAKAHADAQPDAP